MDRSKDAVMKRLINAHFDIEPDIDLIVELVGADENGRDESIKLLEVNRSTTTDGIRPIHFGADAAHDIPFPSIIVEVTPAEFARVKSEELALPEGWRLGRQFHRPAMAQGIKS